MTYEARIEAIARALFESDWERSAKVEDKEKRWEYWKRFFIEDARAADLACLKALEEPTEEMLDEACDAELEAKAAARARYDREDYKNAGLKWSGGYATAEYHPQVWRAMFSKIDRGEQK